MSRAHTTPPLQANNGGCYTCAHWHGERFGGKPVCAFHSKHRIIQADPAKDPCAFWMREIGADDGPIEPTHLQSHYDVPSTRRT